MATFVGNLFAFALLTVFLYLFWVLVPAFVDWTSPEWSPANWSEFDRFAAFISLFIACVWPNKKGAK